MPTPAGQRHGRHRRRPQLRGACTSINFGNSAIQATTTPTAANDVANFVTSSGQVTVNRDQSVGHLAFPGSERCAATFQAEQRWHHPLQRRQLRRTSSTIARSSRSAAAPRPSTPPPPSLARCPIRSRSTWPRTSPSPPARWRNSRSSASIRAAPPRSRRRGSLSSKRALFAQLVDGLDTGQLRACSSRSRAASAAWCPPTTSWWWTG